jgi:hypothetical protein
MLAKPGPLPTGPGWSYEVKWDGFRALVSTADGLKVRSRRGWNMTGALPELRGLPEGSSSTANSSHSTAQAIRTSHFSRRASSTVRGCLYRMSLHTRGAVWKQAFSLRCRRLGGFVAGVG